MFTVLVLIEQNPFLVKLRNNQKNCGKLGTKMGMDSSRKSGILTDEEQAKYKEIVKNKPRQIEKYNQFIDGIGEEGRKTLLRRCKGVGLNLNLNKGQLAYSEDFAPLGLNFDLCYVRHGKTEGNTEPRIFQVRIFMAYVCAVALMQQLSSCMNIRVK